MQSSQQAGPADPFARLTGSQAFLLRSAATWPLQLAGSPAGETHRPHSPWVSLRVHAKSKSLRRSVSAISIVTPLVPFSLYCPTWIGADALCVYCTFLSSPPRSSVVTSRRRRLGIPPLSSPPPKRVHDPETCIHYWPPRRATSCGWEG